MAPETGQRFGPYEILDRVGGGGMGVVFRAWDERLHREVAIKLLYDSYQMPGTRERFLQEARAASKLSHPNICTIYDMGEQYGDPYLVMELLDGETLKEKIARGALSAQEIVAITRDIASALAAAHGKGIVHRDIKPANIFLVNLPVGETQAKVLDFGLAKIDLREDGGWMSRSLDMTLAGATVGTLAYMSPEQACGQELDARSDLFSLGIVMYEMATRRVPFRGTTSALVYTQLIENEPESVRKWNDSIPKELERLILKLLAKERRERFQSAKELTAALQKIANNMDRAWWFFGRRNSVPVPLVPATEPVARQRRPAVIVTQGEQEIETRSVSDKTGESVFIPPLKIAMETATNHFAIPEPASPRIEQRVDPGVRFLGKGSSGINQFEFADDDSLASIEVPPADSASAAPTVTVQNRWKPVTIAIAVIMAVAGAGSLLLRAGELRPVLLKPNDTLFLAAIQNKTGDAALDRAVLEGLTIDLRQSGYLRILGVEAGGAGSRLVEADGHEIASGTLEQVVAQHLGAKAYLFGDIRTEGTRYVLRVDVLNAQSNDKLTSVTEMAGSRNEIPGAIDRLAQAVRIEVGEGRQSIATSGRPLEDIATANLDALSQYFAGERAMADGRAADALVAYQNSVQRDPRFALAQMKLAWLYRDNLAEVASSGAAQIALDAARHSGDGRLKLLTEFCYEMNTTGDYSRALTTIRRYSDQFPDDVDGLLGLSRVLRAQGHYVEALLASQQASRSHPYNVVAYLETELTLLNLDRFDAALGLQAQAGRLGVIVNANGLAAAYLGGDEDAVAEELKQLQNSASSIGVVSDYGLYLENTGQLSAGASVWKGAAVNTTRGEGLGSAEASLVAQGALDNALAGNCGDAVELAAESSRIPLRGPKAIFNSGMARTLCGDASAADRAVEALQNFPHNSAVEQSYVPDLRAAELLQTKRPSEALEFLTREEPSSADPLTRYLRGLADAASGNVQQAADDFRSVLDRRGAAFFSGIVYPMAQLQLARALAAVGSPTESAVAYRQFLLSWSKADKGQGLVAEAAARSKTEANVALVSVPR